MSLIEWYSTKLKFKVGWIYWVLKSKSVQYFIWFLVGTHVQIKKKTRVNTQAML